MGIGEVKGGRPPRRRAVFLDRDGVLNATVARLGGQGPPWSLAELAIMPGAAESLERLCAAGFVLIVVTNQPDVARGDLSRSEMKRINEAVLQALPMIRDWRVCAHDNANDCPCRKPKPGMLLGAAARHAVDLRASYMVGDRYKDVEAGQNAGCRTVWIRAVEHDERGPRRPADCEARTLAEAVDWILRDGGRE